MDLKRREGAPAPEVETEMVEEAPQELDFPTACIKIAEATLAIAFALERMAVKQGAMTEDEATYPRE